MIRVAIALACALLSLLPAAAMVGGAQPTSEGAGRAVVMLTGSHGTFCSGVALARDLVLTAAHCVLPGADYKLVEFDAARHPALKDIARITRHPEFDVNAVLRHRVTADVALIKLAAPLPIVPATLAPAGGSVAVGDRFVVAGYGVAVRGDGKSGGTVRAATLVATGSTGYAADQARRSRHQGRARRARRLHRRFRRAGLSRHRRCARRHRRRELVDRPCLERRLRRPHRRDAAHALPRVDRGAGGENGLAAPALSLTRDGPTARWRADRRRPRDTSPPARRDRRSPRRPAPPLAIRCSPRGTSGRAQ